MEIHQTGMRARVPKWACIVHQISKQAEIDGKRNLPPPPHRKRNLILLVRFYGTQLVLIFHFWQICLYIPPSLSGVEYWVEFGPLAIKTTFTSLFWRTRQKECFSFWLRMFSWYCNKRLTIWPKESLFEENASSCNCNSSLDAPGTLEEKPIKAQIAPLSIYMGRKKWSRSL